MLIFVIIIIITIIVIIIIVYCRLFLGHPVVLTRDSQGDCDSKSFTPGCNQGQDEPQVKGATFPIISVPIILR